LAAGLPGCPSGPFAERHHEQGGGGGTSPCRKESGHGGRKDRAMFQKRPKCLPRGTVMSQGNGMGVQEEHIVDV